MDPIEKSKQIKSEADALLKGRGIEALMTKCGDVIYTGSYALDLMVWTDLDLYIVPRTGVRWDDCIADLASAFLRRSDVDRVKVEKSFWKVRPELPRGLGMGVKIPIENEHMPWKLDIWILDEKTRAANLVFMQSIESRLTQSTREVIIRAKTALITNGRTPSMSGVLVYEAVLDKGLMTVDEVVRYVKSHLDL
jgi:hypothetical protein